MQMSLRRKSALASLAIVLAPVLSSCGFEEPTDRDYVPGVGANDRSGVVDVLSAVVVSDADGRGVFIASLANGSRDETITMQSITAENATIGDVIPAAVRPQGTVVLNDPENLADPGSKVEVAPIEVTGDFVAGNYVRVTVSFDNGEDIEVNSPVVRNCGYYAEIPGVEAGPELCPSGNDESH